MVDIFVSYRRDDSQWPAGGINERLEAVFGAGRVFFDTVTIRPGENFREVLGAKVGECKVLLAVIGPRWLDILEGRIGDSNDFVRIEIAEGLRRKVRVIPVLIDGAKPPPEARLPDDLKQLAWHHAIPVRADTFRSDLDQLIGFLKAFLADGSELNDAQPRSRAGETAHYRAEGRIKVDAKFIHGAPEGWFKPGNGKNEWFKDINTGPEMVVVPGVPDDPAFAIGRFTLTFAEWDAAQAHHEWETHAGVAPRKPNDHKWGRGEQPAIDVSWDDAKAYCKWLSSVAGKTYRLPTGTEWEYACRARTKTEFWWGNEISAEQANYNGDYTFGFGKKGEKRLRTVPVNSFTANPWGLYQVHGNVWEWCVGDYGTSSWVLRGGSWSDSPDLLRSSLGVRVLPLYPRSVVGFRVARTL